MNSVPRNIAKTLSFGLLYGRKAGKLLPSIPEPSAVERLAALTDPVIADRVLRYDDPDAWCAKVIDRWGNMQAGYSDRENMVRLMLENEAEHMSRLRAEAP